jgi:hypothetical protein
MALGRQVRRLLRTSVLRLSRAKTALPPEHGAKAALLEVGIEDFDVHERGFRDEHSVRCNAQQRKS